MSVEKPIPLDLLHEFLTEGEEGISRPEGAPALKVLTTLNRADVSGSVLSNLESV